MILACARDLPFRDHRHMAPGTLDLRDAAARTGWGIMDVRVSEDFRCGHPCHSANRGRSLSRFPARAMKEPRWDDAHSGPPRCSPCWPWPWGWWRAAPTTGPRCAMAARRRRAPAPRASARTRRRSRSRRPPSRGSRSRSTAASTSRP